MLEHFFDILEITSDKNEYTAHIALHAAHEIYQGHFPEQPIVPGVCTMHMIKKCAEKVLGKDNLHFNQIMQCKYLSVIDPRQITKLRILLKINSDEETHQIVASVDYCEQEVVKLKGVLS